jgi:3-hydroxyanthranilate 3,4-dioxygenase
MRMLAQPLKTFNLQQLVERHRAEWDRAGVRRRLVWEDSDYITMLQHGPTEDLQFHVNQGDEIFHQIEGELHFHYVRDDGTRELLIVGPGETFLLPRNVPHSPRRPPGSWTLVVERQRRPDEADGWLWLCERCGHTLHDATVHSGGPREDTPGVVAPWIAAARERLQELESCPACGEAIPLVGDGRGAPVAAGQEAP